MGFDIELPHGLTSSNVGGAGSVALDRAGTTLAFQARDFATIPMIYFRRLDDPSIVRVAGTENAGSPTFSPDGRDLRFFSAAASDTILARAYTVPISGGEQRIWLTARLRTVRSSTQRTGNVIRASPLMAAGLRTPPRGMAARRFMRVRSLEQVCDYPPVGLCANRNPSSLKARKSFWLFVAKAAPATMAVAAIMASTRVIRFRPAALNNPAAATA